MGQIAALWRRAMAWHAVATLAISGAHVDVPTATMK